MNEQVQVLNDTIRPDVNPTTRTQHNMVTKTEAAVIWPI